MNDVYPKPRYQQNRWAKSIRMTVPGGIHVYLLSEQVVQLPLAVLQATSIRAVDDPNQPIGLPTIRKRGVPVNVSEMQLLRHRTARAYWYTFFFFFMCATQLLSGSLRKDFLFLRFYTQRSSVTWCFTSVTWGFTCRMLLTMRNHC